MPQLALGKQDSPEACCKNEQGLICMWRGEAGLAENTPVQASLAGLFKSKALVLLQIIGLTLQVGLDLLQTYVLV